MLRGDDEMEALLAEMGGDTPSTTNVSTTTNIDTTTYQSSSTTNINKNNNNNNNSHHESSNRLKKRNQNKRSRQNKSTQQQQHLTTTTTTTTLNDYNFAETRLLDDPLKWPQRGGFQLTSSLLNPSSCSQWTSKNNNNDYNYSGTCSTCGTSPAHHLMIHVPQPQYNNKKSHYYKRPKKRSYHHHHSDINVLLPRIFVNLRNMRCLCGEYSSSSSSSSFLKSLNSFRQTLTSLLQQLASAKDISEGNVSYLTEPMTDLENAMNELETTATKQEKREFVTREMQWRIMIQLDLIYYRLYYIILTTTTSSSSSSSSRPPVILFIPHPATYFSCHGMAGNVTAGYEALERFLPRLNDETRMLLLDTWGLGENDDDDSDNNNNDNNDNNPLHTLWKHRFLESIRHFWDSGYVQSHSTASSIFRSLTNNPHPKKRRRRRDSHYYYDEALSQHETTTLSPLLSSWRDASRDTPASYYAYATPSPTALKMITTAVAGKRVVEWGAGTGYWAALLQRKGVSVEAYDIAPTTTTTTTTQGGDVNEYHGCVPSFTTVWKGNATSSLDQRRDDDDDDDDVLMLCYPPPDNEMATEALLRCSSRRTMVIHIGEWRGLTGTRQFEQLLMTNYDCVNDISLPVWGTDAASLTIWKKRQQQQQLPTTSSSSLSSSLSFTKSLFGAAACCFCQNCTTMAQKRCRLARVLAYCSKECFEMRGEDERRRSIMALYMLHVPSSAAAADDGSSSAANKKEKEGDGTRTTVTTANDWLDFCNEGHFLDIGGSHGIIEG